jgi:hypothetical protein
MTITITAVYDSPDHVTNALDDLVSTGIPREKIFADKDKSEVKVHTPQTSAPEIEEILKRHQPKDIYQRPLSTS